MCRPGMMEPTRSKNAVAIKLQAIVFETLLEDELNQIQGTLILVDLSGVGVSYLTITSPRELFWLAKNLEVIYWIFYQE